MSRWALLLFVSAVLAVAGAFAGAYLFGGPSDAELEAAAAKAVVANIDQRLEQNCENDLKFRRQYRTRAVVERELLGLELRANEALIEVANAFPGTPELEQLAAVLDRVNFKIDELRSEIVIIPIPDCGPGGFQTAARADAIAAELDSVLADPQTSPDGEAP